MKSFKLCSFLVAVIVMMTITSCIPYRKVVTTPVVPEITIMEKVVVLPEPPVTVVKIRENIMFEYDSAVVEESEMDKIEAVDYLLTNYPDTVIVLKGYASSEGPVDYNLDLSKNRALAVKAILVEKGIDEDRIKILGEGITKLFGNLFNLNRRVIILDIN